MAKIGEGKLTSQLQQAVGQGALVSKVKLPQQ